MTRLLKLSGNYPLLMDRTRSITAGLVGDSEFSVMPQITPAMTFLLTFIFQLPSLITLWRNPSTFNFQKTLVVCGWIAFMFGWHVHEKAIMTFLVPLALLVLSDDTMKYFSVFFWASLFGNFALFPLLFGAQETPIKVAYLIFYHIVLIRISQQNKICDLLSNKRLMMIASSIMFGMQVFYEIAPKGQFLPLMLISSGCGVGLALNCALFLID